ncbi:MAG: hypothetical protein PF636_09145, partial [Actinomycetota bacterium]|nr:hypothetical protein [Actinomycetota bacterium]
MRGWGTLPAHTTGRALAFGLFWLFLLLATLFNPGPASAVDVVSQCLYPCHSSLGLMGPDVETAFMAAGENAGHATNWNSRVIESTTGAELQQGSRIPCTQCHVAHGTNTDSVYSFSSARAGVDTITSIRQLCTGCHRTYDALTLPPVVLGLQMKRLPDGVGDHASASSRPCGDCHGSTGHSPQGHGGASDCGDSACHGGSGSHPVHLDAADPRGPGGMECTDCHADGAFPRFASGTDSDSSGRIDLDETDVCDDCHSPGGSYNGVDSGPAPSGAQSVGAKDNWSSHAYETTSTLSPGKERWCVGCHDGNPDVVGEEPSLIDGVYAPPVAGNEQESYVYGTGWGFYETGHGTPTSTTIPSNGFDPGPGLECDTCHDNTETHIDGDRRSFDATTTAPSTAYRTSYRLDLVDGEDPMLVPWPWREPNTADNYRLCSQSGCHDPYPFLTETVEASSTPSLRGTNFWNENRNEGHNMHKLHLDMVNQLRWIADWGDTNTRTCITCISCHNVHGSTRLGMIHDGSLISDTVERRPGLRIWYLDDVLSEWVGNNQTPPSPDDITLPMSEGWIWGGGSSGNLCTHCHGNFNTQPVLRTPWQDYGIAPTLDWADVTGYEADGASPDSASADDTVVFKISYADGNNDAPLYLSLLIDLNDDGDFADPGETLAMTPDAPTDQTYYNGNLYGASVTPAKVGDDQIDYRFEASDGVTGVTATAPGTITIVNAVPELLWTEETGYASDGVAPNGGTTALTDYDFRIAYRDGDGEGPSGSAPLLRIDKNDDGDYEDVGESIAMTDMGDPSTTVGKRFNHTTTLARQSDDTLNYYFEASDGTDSVQSIAATVTVLQDINLAPSLAWTGETEYEDDGVDPENQASTRPYFFRVTYTDANNDAPGVNEVWVDLDDDSVYEASEKFIMDDSVTPDDPDATDTDYTNGETFAEEINIPFAGDGTIKYCFHFEDDNAAEAIGVQETDRNLSVYTALYVPSVYSTIQLAVDAANTSDTVLVDDGTYLGFAYNGKDITVESVNGPENTFIQTASGTGYVVNFNDYGGSGSDSTIRGFTIRNSQGGITTAKSDVVIEDCIIENMTFTGAIYHTGAASDPLTVRDSIVRDNIRYGVRIANNGAIVEISDTEFNNNTTPYGGAAIVGNGTWNIERCSFHGNTTTSWGGAIYAGGNINLHISDSTFTDNVADVHSGAIHFAGNDTATDVWLDRCVFTGNSSGTSGGAIQLRLGDYEVTNCTFTGNYATDSGGAVYSWNFNRPTFTNCTIAGNSADIGGGLYLSAWSGDNPKVHNSIVWGNDSRSSVIDQIDGIGFSRMSVYYTDIDQGFTAFGNQGGNMRSTPFFVNLVDASNAPTSTGDYHLQEISPCEGQASAVFSPADDIDGDIRPQNGGYDMGSDEIGAPAVSASLTRRLPDWSRVKSESLPGLEDEFALMVTLASQQPAGEPVLPVESSPADAQVGRPLAPT